MPVKINEARPLIVSETAGKPGLFEIQIISPGVGSSGVYLPAVLEAAATDRVFPAGTHLFLDHPTEQEERNRPERSVRDLGGALVEDARWNGEALVATARVYSTYRPLLAEAAQDIGMSIRASAEVSEGEYDGQKVTMIDKLVEGYSVDFVTRAGRGGAILAVLESARDGLRETTTDDRRDQLDRLLPPHSYVRDYDPEKSIVYYVTWDDNDESERAIYAQPYEVGADGLTVSLTGTATAVRTQTTYVPVSAGQNTPTESIDKELINMPQIEEARLRELEAAAERVSTLEAERDKEKQRADQAEAATRARDLRDAATKRAREAVKDLPPQMADRIVGETVAGDLPCTDAGALNDTVFDQTVEAAIKREQAYAATFAPQGLNGFGQSGPAATESAPSGRNPWGREIKEG